MTRNKSSNPKKQALQENGTLNPRSAKVADPLFRHSEFFDPQDLVQVKYEMLRRAGPEGETVVTAAGAFGFSRVAFYQAQAAFARAGLAGLIPQKRGPHAAHKLTAEVVDFLIAAKGEDTSLRPAAMAALVVERFGFAVHPRSIERAFARRQKKQQKRKRK